MTGDAILGEIARDGAGAAIWRNALEVAALFAIDPAGFGGVRLRGLPGPARDRWLETLRDFIGDRVPVLRMSHAITDDRLLGGLDLAASLQAGRAVLERGMLAEADGGIVIAAMAERLSASTAAKVAAVMDAGAVQLDRDGLRGDLAARIAVIALDEGVEEGEAAPTALQDRLAFHLDLSSVGWRDALDPGHAAEDIAAARARLPGVSVSDAAVETVCAVAAAFGIASLRAPIQAVHAARCHAALHDRTEAVEDDLKAAAALVLGPRALMWPQAAEDAPPEDEVPPEDESSEDADVPDEDAGEVEIDPDALKDMLIEAAAAQLPPDILARLKLASERRAASVSAGKSGAARLSKFRGRPVGVRRGDPRAGARLNVFATLLAAAPWQPLRRRETGADPNRVLVRAEDLRINRYKQRAGTLIVFAVDASGSAALHRLAEAKGAVELLLADSYARRDRVAMIAFRGDTADLRLPPTRSLTRAKRQLAGLPGGGGTPLPAALEAAIEVCDQAKRHGDTPILILLTDGRANIARDGTPGRGKAAGEAEALARQIAMTGVTVLFVDTAPRPRPDSRELAARMNAVYLPLPHAGAEALSGAVKSVAGR